MSVPCHVDVIYRGVKNEPMERPPHRVGLYAGEMQMLTGIDQSACSKIERGERYLSFEQCKRVALALHTGMDYLAGLTDEKAPYPRKKAE